MMSNSNLIPINSKMLGRNYRYEMEVSTNINDEEYTIQYGYEFEWKDSPNKSPKIVSEFFEN